MKKIIKEIGVDNFIAMGVASYGANCWLGLLRRFIAPRYLGMGLISKICMTAVQLVMVFELTLTSLSWYGIIKKCFVSTEGND